MKGLVMKLKKFLKSKEKSQSIIEYSLLVAIAIIALLLAHFLINVKNNAFENHFGIAKFYIGGTNF
jgi:cell division protein FtsL